MFEYSADAGFFPRRRSGCVTSPVGYHRLAPAVDTSRFEIEVQPPTLLKGSFLKVNDEELGADQIRQLYHHDRFARPRKPGAR